MRPTLKVLALGAACMAGAAQAQDREGLRDFCPDRPGKGSPSCVLDAGVFQVELGAVEASFQRAGPGSSETYAIGDLALRLGLTPTLEGQIAWTPYAETRSHAGGATSRTSGVGDLTFVLRKSLRNPDGSGVSVALQPFVSAPTGKRGVGAGGWQGGLIAPISAPLTQEVALGLAPEVDIVRDADGRGTHLAWSLAAGVSRQVGPVTLGAELWGAIDDDPAGELRQASVDLTLAWTPPGYEDLQFDFGVYGGLTADTPDLEVSVGASRRF
jgi:hypothetical protein